MIGGGDDSVVGTTVTVADGRYLFDLLLQATYYVDVTDGTVPTGLSLSPGSSDPSALKTISTSERFLDLDFGYPVCEQHGRPPRARGQREAVGVGKGAGVVDGVGVRDRRCRHDGARVVRHYNHRQRVPQATSHQRRHVTVVGCSWIPTGNRR